MNVKAKEVDEGDVQSQIFNSLLNTPVQIILSKTGDILEVNGGDSLVTKMANASGIEDDFSKNMMKKSLEKNFGSAKNTWTLISIDEVNALINGMADVTMETSDLGTIMNLTGKQTTEIKTDAVSGFIQSMIVEGQSEGVTTITSKITYQLIKD